MIKEKFLNYIIIILSIFAVFYAVFTESNIKNKYIATVFLVLAIMFKIVSIILKKREIKNINKKQEELRNIINSKNK